MTYNVMAPVSPPLRFNGQRERMKAIPAQIAAYSPDVVVVQESMVRSQHAILASGMAEVGLGFSTEQITANRLMSGGVVIFANRPIEAQAQFAFESAAGSDMLAAKGFSYALVGGVHVVGFHFQAWPTQAAKAVREAQAAQIRRFIDALPSEEPVVLCGDLNADFYSERRHVRRLVDIMGVTISELTADSHEYSSDPATNALCGNDDKDAYVSDRYPRGCYDQYVETMRCACCPRELLDYILFRNVPAFESRVVPIKAAVYMDINASTRRLLSDLSDHYPVFAEVPLHLTDRPLVVPPKRRLPWVALLSYPLMGAALILLLAYASVRARAARKAKKEA